MAENMSAAAIEVLIQNLINVFKEERSLIRGLDGDSKQLQTTLCLIQSYLNDAQKKSIAQGAVTIWLKELEALAFDADNVLDELNYHLLHKKFKKMKVLSCFSSFNHIARRRNMALRIKQINTSFESMNKMANELGLQSMVVNAPPAAHVSLETDSITSDPIFIGRDDDVPKLVEILLSESVEKQIFSILAIVGMGGMGKTTLTRKVFNHEEMKNRFGSLIWVHVSQTSNPIILLKKILSVLTSSQIRDGVETREVILKKLHEALKDKTYLLVLDDVWNEDLPKWEDFVNALAGVTSTKGNGVIMTTRNGNVASMVRPLHIHLLNGLSDEECWSIIKAKAFENGDVVPISRFEMVGRKIAKRCGGLPLAANVIGGMLRYKSEQEWRLINENWVSEGENDISKILKLSFDNLSSPSLKKCFAYCSVFPKGYTIDVQRLIELWMAEGFLQSDEINEMETVGNKFVNVLLHNSLLQVVERDEYENVQICTMHDLVHDLATSVLGNDSNGLKQARYVIHDSHHSNPIQKESTKYLRTLFLKGEISGTIFSDFESLHVLTLSHHKVDELPSSIKKLIHLRKLDISLTRIKNLPEWIGELHHLQTLRAYTEFLDKMPSGLKYLSNLRHLYISARTELPAEIGRLTCLQTLRYFAVGDRKGYKIEELGSLKCLKGELVISNLEKVHAREEAEKAKIFQKRDLLKLTFQWIENREVETNDESVLEGLQPYHNLKTLVIDGFKGERFPLWTQKMAVRDDGPQDSWIVLDKLISIRLYDCDECEEIPRLDHLPNLKYLSLSGLRKVRFIINSPFNKLTTLKIKGLEELECLPDLLFYNNQHLSLLRISGCPKLEKLPDGMTTLNSLKELKIWGCQNLKSMGNPYPSGGGQSQLETMRIALCENLLELPHQMVESSAQSLTWLSLDGLSSLQNMPMVIDCLAKAARLTPLRLQRLEIDVGMESCVAVAVNIKESVDDILQGCCNSLTTLSLTGMENREWVPTSIQHLTRLTCLELMNFGFKELPELSENLSFLSLKNCKKLRRLPTADSLRLINNFIQIYVTDCPELRIDSELLYDIPGVRIWVDGERIKTSISRVLSTLCFCLGVCKPNPNPETHPGPSGLVLIGSGPKDEPVRVGPKK